MKKIKKGIWTLNENAKFISLIVSLDGDIDEIKKYIITRTQGQVRKKYYWFCSNFHKNILKELSRLKLYNQKTLYYSIIKMIINLKNDGLKNYFKTILNGIIKELVRKRTIPTKRLIFNILRYICKNGLIDVNNTIKRKYDNKIIIDPWDF